MAWKKLDDDLAAAGMPYSSLLADELTYNVNSYSSLNSGSSITWPADDGPMWASYGQPMGTVITLDVGVNCGSINFSVFYRTATANGDANGFSGRVYLRHLTSGREVSQRITPSVTGSTVVLLLEFDAVSNLPSGPQAFFLSFQSHVLELRGLVGIKNGYRNQVYLYTDSGSYPFSSGEKYELLTVGGEKKYAVEPDSLGTYAYQIGYASVFDEGQTFVIWPELDNSPAIIPNGGTPSRPIDGYVYELGALGVLSIEYRVFGGPARNPRQLAHAPAYSLNSLVLEQTLAAVELRPDVAANASEARLGYLLQSYDQISGVFATQADTVGRLSVSFRAVRVDENNGDNINFSLTVLKQTGGVITPEVVTLRPVVPRMSYQNAIATSATSMRVIEGVRRGPRSWGMRDSMPLTDCLKGTPMYLETAPFLLPGAGGSIQGGSVATFVLKVTGGDDLSVYVYGFNARFD